VVAERKDSEPNSLARSRVNRARAGSQPDHNEPLIDSGADLAAALPESLTINVDLPATVHAVPESEVALSIDNVAIDPSVLEHGESLATSSISIIGANLTVPVSAAPVVEVETVQEIPALPEAAAYSRRDRLNGVVSVGPESAAMLTADRLMDSRKRRRPSPEGFLPSLVFALTFRMVNIGDSPKIRLRKELDARIGRRFEGSSRFVPVLTRKGGVGKTTVTTLIGMAMASVREDRVIAIDANPDRGTLAERINKQTNSTVRDVVIKAASISDFTQFSTHVSRDETRLDVLASDTDPLLSEAFDENDYNVVADLAARFYDVVLTDCGTGIVHSVMRATLQRADSLVIVSGGSVDEARLASETLTWLEANGYAELVRNSIVALNTATQGTNLIKLEEIEAHFQSRVREIVRIPYDPVLAAGSIIDFAALRPLTRAAARELAALVVDGLHRSRDL
jgi:MinD-like ATPase involved in chromosome partitioning or flagellar assembly